MGKNIYQEKNNTKNKFNNNEEKATAPYNFVELHGRVIERYKSIEDLPKHNRYYKDRVSGTIEYEIESDTPIMIGEDKKNNEISFFKNINDKYAIPGNTLRGMVRNNLITLGMCIVGEDIEDSRFLHRTIAGVNVTLRNTYKRIVGVKVEEGGKCTVLKNVEAGYIKCIGKESYEVILPKLINENSYIRIGEKELKNKVKNVNEVKYMYRDVDCKQKNTSYKPYYTEISFSKVDEGKKVRIKEIKNKDQLKYNGYILGSGFMNKKQAHYVIGEPSDEIKNINSDILKESIEAYKKDLILTKKQENSLYSLPENINQIKPIFYVESENEFYFGMTPTLRVLHSGSIHNGIKEELKNREIIDYSKAIFGFTNFKGSSEENNNSSYKSRVAFQDAEIQCKAKFAEKNAIILSKPKATCVAHYIKQDNKEVSNSYSDKKFTIRGIKHYWMMREIGKIESDKDNVKSILNPLDSGMKFKGKINFDNLSNDELGLILWSLKISDKAYQNIGMGKPYGYGRIKIKNINLNIENIESKYESFSLKYKKEKNIDNCIEEYKKYIQEEHNVNIENLESTKNLIAMKEITKPLKYVSYMKVGDFNKKVLPKIGEV